MLYRGGDLNPFTEKGSKTQGSEVTFIEPPKLPRRKPTSSGSQPSIPPTLCSLTVHLLLLFGNLGRPFFPFLVHYHKYRAFSLPLLFPVMLWSPIKTELKVTSCGFLDRCHHLPAFPNGKLKEMALEVLFLAAIEKCQEHHKAVYDNRLLTPAHTERNFQYCDSCESVVV